VVKGGKWEALETVVPGGGAAPAAAAAEEKKPLGSLDAGYK